MIRYSSNLPPGLAFTGKERIRKTAHCSSKGHVVFMEKLCQHFINNPDPLVVPVYRFDNHNFKRSGSNYSYSYDMMALGMLSKHEKDLINDISERWDRFSELPSESKDEDTIQRYKVYPELISFMDKVLSQRRYYDLHDGNIMIDLEENYRLIDLEGFYCRSLAHPSNKWITSEAT